MEWLTPKAALRQLAGANAVSCSEEEEAAMAAALRRAAEQRCPTTAAALIRAARESLEGILDRPADDWEEILDGLFSYGDLIERVDPGPPKRCRVHAHPPALVDAGGKLLLVGVDSGPDLRDWSPHRMNRRGLIRIVGPTDCTTAEVAKQAGLPVLDIRGWAKGPRQETATAVVARFERLLGAAPACGTIAGLRLLDRPSTYNKNLDPSKARPGVWVGATPSSWATRAWCVVRLDDRLCPDRVVELPRDPSLPAFGEAWRITCALGAAEGTPATFSHDGSFLRLSFPAPPWVARQLDLLGSRSTAAPFRWLLPAKDLPVVRSLLRNELWMVELPPPRSPDQR